MDQQELIAKMRARVSKCRQLAEATTDPRAAAILQGMANEGDADIARLLNDNDGHGVARSS